VWVLVVALAYQPASVVVEQKGRQAATTRAREQPDYFRLLFSFLLVYDSLTHSSSLFWGCLLGASGAAALAA
jgi:hypothetical protein